MAKTKVYSRMPNAVTFRFLEQNGKDVPACPDKDKITLNGTTEIVNHTLVTRDGALTIFAGGAHDLEKRIYSEADFDRLKEHPLFKAALKNGDVSIGTPEDLSLDEHPGTFMTPARLQKELAASKGADGESVSLSASSES